MKSANLLTRNVGNKDPMNSPMLNAMSEPMPESIAWDSYGVHRAGCAKGNFYFAAVPVVTLRRVLVFFLIVCVRCRTDVFGAQSRLAFEKFTDESNIWNT